MALSTYEIIFASGTVSQVSLQLYFNPLESHERVPLGEQKQGIFVCRQFSTELAPFQLDYYTEVFIRAH